MPDWTVGNNHQLRIYSDSGRNNPVQNVTLAVSANALGNVTNATLTGNLSAGTYTLVVPHSTVTGGIEIVVATLTVNNAVTTPPVDVVRDFFVAAAAEEKGDLGIRTDGTTIKTEDLTKEDLFGKIGDDENESGDYLTVVGLDLTNAEWAEMKDSTINIYRTNNIEGNLGAIVGVLTIDEDGYLSLENAINIGGSGDYFVAVLTSAHFATDEYEDITNPLSGDYANKTIRVPINVEVDVPFEATEARNLTLNNEGEDLFGEDIDIEDLFGKAAKFAVGKANNVQPTFASATWADETYINIYNESTGALVGTLAVDENGKLSLRSPIAPEITGDFVAVLTYKHFTHTNSIQNFVDGDIIEVPFRI